MEIRELVKKEKELLKILNKGDLFRLVDRASTDIYLRTSVIDPDNNSPTVEAVRLIDGHVNDFDLNTWVERVYGYFVETSKDGDK